MKKSFLGGIAALLLSTVLLTGCTIGDTEYVFYEQKVDDRTVFSINSEKCSIAEIMIYLCNYKNIYGNSYGIRLWEKEELTASLEEYVRGVTLAESGRVICMYELAKEQEIGLTEEETEKVEKTASEYYASLSEEETAFMNVKESDIALAYEHYAVAMKLYETLTEGVNEEVSDDEARVIRVNQIYVQDEETAGKVAEKLESGEEFEAVAGTYNKAESMETTIARGEYPKEVEQIAFSLDNGTMSGMIATEEGYFFIKCISKLEPELTEANKSVIVLQRRKEQFDDLYQDYVDRTDFVLNEELWNGITLDGAEEIHTDSFFEIYNKNFSIKE